MGYSKVIDATSGSFSKTTNNEEHIQFVISGTPNANIKLFMIERTHQHLQPFVRIKVFCPDWNGASVVVKYKTNHPDDDFTETGDVFRSNDIATLEF